MFLAYDTIVKHFGILQLAMFQLMHCLFITSFLNWLLGSQIVSCFVDKSKMREYVS